MLASINFIFANTYICELF